VKVHIFGRSEQKQRLRLPKKQWKELTSILYQNIPVIKVYFTIISLRSTLMFLYAKMLKSRERRILKHRQNQ
jgi:hypothetical protein